VLRMRVMYWDGSVDEQEEQWEIATVNNEIDAAGLSLSYLAVMDIRAAVMMQMPDPGGTVHAPVSSVLQVIVLLIAAVVCKSISFIPKLQPKATAASRRHLSRRSHHQGSRPTTFARLPNNIVNATCMVTMDFETKKKIFVNTVSKMSGWLLLFTVQGAIRYFSDKLDHDRDQGDESVSVRAVTAILCTYLSFGLILLLKYLCLPQKFKAGMLQTTSMMVGFSWRRSYGLSLDYLSMKAAQRTVTNMTGDKELDEWLLEIFVAIPTVLVMLPALYWYITPNVLTAEAETKAEASLTLPPPTGPSSSLIESPNTAGGGQIEMAGATRDSETGKAD